MIEFFSRLFRLRQNVGRPSGLTESQEVPTTIVYAGILDALRDVTDQDVGFAFNSEAYAKRRKVEITVRGYNDQDEYPDFDFVPPYDEIHAENCENMIRLAFTGLTDQQEEIFWRLLNRTGWKKIYGGCVDNYTDYMVLGENPHEPKTEEASIYGVEMIDFWIFVRMALRCPVDWTNDRNTQISDRTLARLKDTQLLDNKILCNLTEEDAKIVLGEVRSAA